MTESREEFIMRLGASGIAQSEEIIGCTEAEICRVEQAAGVILPDAYKCFLRSMGRRAGKLMDDVFVFYDKMIGLTEVAQRIVLACEGDKLSLPDDAYVFAMRGGEQFTFFIADGSSPDPAVYFYHEGDGKFAKTDESIWDFLEAERQSVETFLSDCKRIGE